MKLMLCMKKLMLVRHATAMHDTGLEDFERPLTGKGLHEAEKMAMRLQHEHIKPDILIASPALRTLSTANVFSEILMMHPAKIVKAIYDAQEEGLLNIIGEFSDQYNFIGLVGHNPAITRVLHTLSGTDKEVPPCTVAVIEFTTDTWAGVQTHPGELTYYNNPAIIN